MVRKCLEEEDDANLMNSKEEEDANLMNSTVMNSTAKRLQDVFKMTMAFGGMCLEEEQEVHLLDVFPS